MQQPVGYVVQDSRLALTSISALIFNPNLWVHLPHTVAAVFTTAAFFVMGISDYHMMRKHNPDAFQRSFQIAAIIGMISIVLVGLVGLFMVMAGVFEMTTLGILRVIFLSTLVIEMVSTLSTAIVTVEIGLRQ